VKKPWNIANLPIYSLATYNEQGEVNMNICTYVSAVSMQPKRMMIAVYKGTKSLMNLDINKFAVLQLLHENQYGLVRVLGHKSGKSYNKANYLAKKNILTSWQNVAVLKEANAWMYLNLITTQDAGDHIMHLFDVSAHKTNSDQNYLDINFLREKKLIRI
jgi:flavin reductase (DIM6/NTAB) family NADH-FMN oxidoreductase RutF